MPTNIVLLSDGTGNSASSAFKTNVWRLYQTLNIGPPPQGLDPQIVYYDNGVGTENFKPLAALGGALGIGVWNNVKHLYTFVCRNYEKDDRIYGFGFSRGAFTIRLLMAMIGKCGILKADSEAKLVECVEMAYEAFQRDHLLRASRQRRMIYHHLPWLKPPKLQQTPNSPETRALHAPPTRETIKLPGCEQEFPDIEFVGVWDTVDAYGMPVDEIKLAIDDWVWPMSFADRDPSPSIRVIRHALSIDDERPTFRPVLWNEMVKDPTNPNKRIGLQAPHIKQVWFAGVHANVGGGYPDDGLAHVTLDWMLTEAGKQHLHFLPVERQFVRDHANAHGEQYDSRSGVAGYYRYGPRNIKELCKDAEHDVTVNTVYVHESAYERIVQRRREYGPVSLNAPFMVLGRPAKECVDLKALEDAFDIVWWRRFVYFTTLELTAFLALFLLRPIWPFPRCPLPDIVLGWTEAILRVPWRVFTTAIGDSATQWIVGAWTKFLGFASGFVPGWAAGAIPSLGVYPLTGIVAAVLLAFMFFSWSDALHRRIEVFSEWAWAKHKVRSPGQLGLLASAQPPTDWRNPVARFIRPITAFLYRTVWRKFFVLLLGWVLGLVALAVFSPVWILSMFRRRPWMEGQ
jgi:uncharacterized protein (DUF2235 family)